MTIRELFREFVAERRREKVAERQAITQAWQTAALTRQAIHGKLPELSTILANLDMGQGISTTVQKTRLALLGEFLGRGGVRKASKAAKAALRRLRANG